MLHRGMESTSWKMISSDFTFDENAVLGKFSEEAVLQEDLIRSAANQILRRLQALLRNSK